MTNDRQKTRFNFIDVLIILIILAVVGAAVYLIVTGNMEARRSESANIEFTVRLSAVDEEYLSLIRENESVKDSSTDKVIGTIQKITMEKTRYYVDTAIPAGNGYTVTAAEYDDKYDVYVTISAYAKADDRGIYTIGSSRILVGAPIYFKVPSFTAVSYITAFSTGIPG